MCRGEALLLGIPCLCWWRTHINLADNKSTSVSRKKRSYYYHLGGSSTFNTLEGILDVFCGPGGNCGFSVDKERQQAPMAEDASRQEQNERDGSQSSWTETTLHLFDPYQLRLSC